ncbi:hypothetical protein JXQ70_18430 [bacterium]|nr:hypothetical protein [bacterium]
MDETRFIQENADSLHKLELLVFFYDNPSTMDTAESLAIWSGIPLVDITPILAQWSHSGILKQEGAIFYLMTESDLFPILEKVVLSYKSTRRLFRVELDKITQQQREEQRRHEAALTLETGKTDTLLESISDAVILIDKDRSITRFNRVFPSFFPSFNPSQLPCSFDFFKSDQELYQVFTTLFAKGEGSHKKTLGERCYEIVITSIKDEYGSALLDETGQSVGFVWVFHDISMQMQLDRMKEELSRMITHDLRSPMAGILTAFELLLKNAQESLSENLYKSCQLGKKTSQFLLDMVNDLLDVQTIEDGTLPIATGPTTIQDLVSESLDQVSSLAQDRLIELSSDLPHKNCRLMADHSKLVRVFVNLLTNALKFTPKKGSVSIEHVLLESGDRAFAEKADPESSRIIIRVQDNGAGIPPEDLPFVFDKYYRAQQSKKSYIAGTGLGLYFCKLILKAHHGDIWVENRQPQGSTFSVLLPLTGP